MQKRKADAWVDEQAQGDGRQWRCWVGLFPGFGCESLFTKSGYNFKVKMCDSCCNRLAEKWDVAFDDLDNLLCAIAHVQGHSWPLAPGKQQAEKANVWPVLHRMGVKLVKRGGNLIAR